MILPEYIQKNHKNLFKSINFINFKQLFRRMGKMSKEQQIKKLKLENKALKETCEILADEEAVKNIQKSLDEIKKGNYAEIKTIEPNKFLVEIKN